MHLQEHQKADAKTQGANRPTIPAGTYYFVVLPQTFTTGFTIEAYQEGNATDKPNYTRTFGGKITLPRSRVLNVGEMAPDPFNGHDYVDLGIEVDGYKVLWATMNVGASTPEGNGDYFAWGETTPYYQNWSGSGKPTSWKDGKSAGYKWESYCGQSSFTEWSTVPYDDNKVLKPEYDAAHVIWGGDWVMPTQAEWAALCNTDNCTREWTKLNNVNGWKFTSKKDSSKSIFLPAAGDFLGTSIYYVGDNGFCWSSSLYAGDSTIAYYFSFGSSTVGSDYHRNNRYYGQSVRPVIRMVK